MKYRHKTAAANELAALEDKPLKPHEEEMLWASCTGGEVGAGSSDDEDHETEDRCEVSHLHSLCFQRVVLPLYEWL